MTPAEQVEWTLSRRRLRRSGCPLTPRQVQVLSLLASGEVARTKQVAVRLGLTLKTVQNYLDTAARVLGTSGALQTMVVAVQQGWVEMPARVDEADEAA